VKSTVTFKDYFNEDMTAGLALGGSPGGFSPDNISGSDFYAPNDARIAKGGSTYTRAGKVKRNRKRKIKRKNNKPTSL
jgi:hypothetical protein